MLREHLLIILAGILSLDFLDMIGMSSADTKSKADEFGLTARPFDNTMVEPFTFGTDLWRCIFKIPQLLKIGKS